MKRRALWLLILCVLSSSAGQVALSQEDSEDLATPTQGTFVRQAELVGNIDAQHQSFLAPTFSAKLEMLAEEGLKVKKGQLVARLETKDLEDQLDDKELSLQAAVSDLSEHDHNMAADKVRQAAEVDRAQAVLDEKKLALRLLLAGTRPEELEKKRLAQQLAQKAVDLARSDLGLKEKLAAKGMSTALEVLQARLNLANKERDFEVAQADLIQARQGATALERDLARLEVQQAEQTLIWARKNQTFQAQSAVLEHQKKEANRGAVAADVKQLQRQLKEAEIRAPLDGTVVINKTPTQTGLKRVGVGDEVFEGNPFMSVADLSQVVIRAEVDESLLRDLKLGMTCTIRLPSMQGKHFSGKISRIGVFAHDRTGRQQTQGLSKVFDLEILPNEQGTVFQPGTSVDIQLPLMQKKEVLLLPREAIYREGDHYYVILEKGNRQTVELGEVNAKEVEITAGLQSGQSVQLPSSTDKQKKVSGVQP